MAAKSISDTSGGLPHLIQRDNIFDGVLQLYRSNRDKIVTKYPFFVSFQGERAVDMGGVAREMFTLFFEEAYQKLFDGCTLLTPVIYPGVDMSLMEVFGAIMSHAYLVSGVLPVRVAFPTLAPCLLGANVKIPDDVMLSSFMSCLSSHESAVLKDALGEVLEFTDETYDGLINIFSHYGFRQVITPQNLRSSVVRVALCEFVLKPSAVISGINRGIPSQHASFWQELGWSGLYSLYKAKSVSTGKVLKMFSEEEGINPDQERVLLYLRQYVGGMNNDDLSQFLRFVTGSSVCMAKKIQVTFNAETGIARRPIAHT